MALQSVGWPPAFVQYRYGLPFAFTFYAWLLSIESTVPAVKSTNRCACWWDQYSPRHGPRPHTVDWEYRECIVLCLQNYWRCSHFTSVWSARTRAGVHVVPTPPQSLGDACCPT